MRVAVLQSSYVPWKGYFDIIHEVDRFVFYDDVQYSKNGWRNRNRIKTPAGPQWLTVPVGPRESRLICEVDLPADPSWAERHWRLLQQHYGEAPYFSRYAPELEDVYAVALEEGTLSALNQELTRTICGFLGITTGLADSRDYPLEGRKQDRLLDLLQQLGATSYLSGPAARAYLEPERFEEAGIELLWKDYAGYPEYPQLHPPFVHEVSILDLLFHTGPEAPRYIWGWR